MCFYISLLDTVSSILVCWILYPFSVCMNAIWNCVTVCVCPAGRMIVYLRYVAKAENVGCSAQTFYPKHWPVPSSSSSVFWAISLGFTTLEVTFCPHGWCVLGVFLLPASTRLGQECQEILSLCDGIHVCTDQALVYTLIWKSFLGLEAEPMFKLQ